MSSRVGFVAELESTRRAVFPCTVDCIPATYTTPALSEKVRRLKSSAINRVKVTKNDFVWTSKGLIYLSVFNRHLWWHNSLLEHFWSHSSVCWLADWCLASVKGGNWLKCRLCNERLSGSVDQKTNNLCSIQV